MEDASALHFVVGGRFLVVHLLAAEDESLLRRRNSFFLLDALFDPLDFVGRFDVDLDFFPRQRLHLDQHDRNI